MHAHTHMHVITTGEKRGHEFESRGKGYVRVWRDKREDRNMIKIQSQK